MWKTARVSRNEAVILWKKEGVLLVRVAVSPSSTSTLGGAAEADIRAVRREVNSLAVE
jgi:hypothetical protein